MDSISTSKGLMTLFVTVFVILLLFLIFLMYLIDYYSSWGLANPFFNGMLTAIIADYLLLAVCLGFKRKGRQCGQIVCFIHPRWPHLL